MNGLHKSPNEVKVFPFGAPRCFFPSDHSINISHAVVPSLHPSFFSLSSLWLFYNVRAHKDGTTSIKLLTSPGKSPYERDHEAQGINLFNFA